MLNLEKDLQQNTYPGRGIVIGRSKDGKNAMIGYFIMGRSENSRNRIFAKEPDGIRTEAFDPAKLVDPSLIIYHPVRVVGDTTVVTNGDQTDTVADFLKEGKIFEEALRTRTFEPDGPNWTPRISGMVEKNGDYRLSILKSADGDENSTRRYSLSTPLPAQVRVISSTPMSTMATPFRPLRASRSLWSCPMPASTASPSPCGTA